MASATCYVTTAAGTVYPVTEGIIHLPRVGVWHANLILIAYGVPAQSGKVVVTLGDENQGTPLSFSGTFGANGPTQRGTLRVHINGGGGGLSTVLTPKGYRAVPLQIPMTDLLNDAGEVLSPTADPNVLAAQLPFWVRIQQTAALGLSSLLQVTGTTWRVLPDGTIWFGTETYPTGSMSLVQVHFEPELNRYYFVSYLPTILPGQTFVSPVSGVANKVSSVVHYLTPDDFHSYLFYE